MQSVNKSLIVVFKVKCLNVWKKKHQWGCCGGYFRAHLGDGGMGAEKFEILLYAEVLVEAIYKKKPCILTCRELWTFEKGLVVGKHELLSTWWNKIREISGHVTGKNCVSWGVLLQSTQCSKPVTVSVLFFKARRKESPSCRKKTLLPLVSCPHYSLFPGNYLNQVLLEFAYMGSFI